MIQVVLAAVAFVGRAIHASPPGVERSFCVRRGISLSYTRADRPGLFDRLSTPDRY